MDADAEKLWLRAQVGIPAAKVIRKARSTQFYESQTGGLALDCSRTSSPPTRLLAVPALKTRLPYSALQADRVLATLPPARCAGSVRKVR